jgi:hypothetical protein
MSFLLKHGRSIVKSILSPTTAVETRNTVKASLRPRLLLKTAVAGHDNKHNHYKTQIVPKWRYGDDACFVANTVNADLIGIADGVGGWRCYGIDPSQFSRTLMMVCENLVMSDALSHENAFPDPLWLISQSYNHITEMKKPILGSATTCIIAFNRSEGYVCSAILGDSGYIIVRRGRVVFRSLMQKHAFNTPFQLALLPQSTHPVLAAVAFDVHEPRADQPEPHPVAPGLRLHAAEALVQDAANMMPPQHHFHQDRPELAHQSRVQVEVGDVIVAGSDGLFDNVLDSVIASEVHQAQVSCQFI